MTQERNTPRVRKLIHQVAAILKVTGIRAYQLAEAKGWHRQELSRWMTFERMPAGENTLALLEWVNKQLNTTLRKPDRRRAYEKALAEIEKGK